MAAVTICSDFGAQEIKSDTVSTVSTSISHEVMGPDAVMLEKTLESPLDCKKIQPVRPKGNHSWIFIGWTDAEAETPTLWPPHAKSWLIGKDPAAWEGLGAGGEGDDRRWDGWMASLTRTWVWVDSGSWWWTGRPGVLRFKGSQRVGYDWVTELNWIELVYQWEIMKM